MLGKIIGVMEMDNAFLVSLHHFLGKQKPLGNVLADLTGHIVPLDAVHYRVFIGIFLEDFLVIAL